MITVGHFWLCAYPISTTIALYKYIQKGQTILYHDWSGLSILHLDWSGLSILDHDWSGLSTLSWLIRPKQALTWLISNKQSKKKPRNHKVEWTKKMYAVRDIFCCLLIKIRNNETKIYLYHDLIFYYII